MRFIKILLAASLLLCIGVSSEKVSAQAGQQEKTAQTTRPAQSKDYTFVTPEGGNLSILARRALQLYDQDNDKVSLTPAQAVAAETALVQILGGRLLEIGEKVTITTAQLQDQVAKVQALDQATLSAWQEYALGTDFNVSYVNAEGQAQSTTGNPASPDKPAVEKSDNQSANQEASKSTRDAGPRRNSIYWFWLPLAVAALIYLLTQRNNQTSAPAQTPKAGAKRSPVKKQSNRTKRKK